MCCSSCTNNLTIWSCPKRAARWSGVAYDTATVSPMLGSSRPACTPPPSSSFLTVATLSSDWTAVWNFCARSSTGSAKYRRPFTTWCASSSCPSSTSSKNGCCSSSPKLDARRASSTCKHLRIMSAASDQTTRLISSSLRCSQPYASVSRSARWTMLSASEDRNIDAPSSTQSLKARTPNDQMSIDTEDIKVPRD